MYFVLTNSNTDITQVIATDLHMIMVGDEDCQC